KLGEEGYEYYWEPYPVDAPFSRRLNWAFDLLTNFKGEGKHSLTTEYLPSPTPWVVDSLAHALSRLELGHLNHTPTPQAKGRGLTGEGYDRGDPTSRKSRLRPLRYPEAVPAVEAQDLRPDLPDPRRHPHL